MDKQRMPRSGEIYHHFKDKLYQVVTVAEHTDTGERMVVYQALYGDFKTYVRPLTVFLSEVDQDSYPEVKQKYKYELWQTQDGLKIPETVVNKEEKNDSTAVIQENQIPAEKTEDRKETLRNKNEKNQMKEEVQEITSDGVVNTLLLRFLDAESYNKKLEILTSNIKHVDDRLINDMAVALDCAVDEGPLDQRIQALINCLQAMRRFEDRRLR
jgi:hypothetical protein